MFKRILPKSNPLDQKGFTMVELAIVIVLIGIIAMTASLLIGQAAQTYQKEDNYSAVLNQGRLALEKMAREIRMIKSSGAGDLTACTATTLSFTDIMGNIAVYSFSGATITENINGAGANVLADNLSVFSFSYLDNSGAVPASCSAIWTIILNLTPAQGGETLPVRVTVHPRNF
ncbi:MAG: PilW family protein [Nitrospiria bacterium]